MIERVNGPDGSGRWQPQRSERRQGQLSLLGRVAAGISLLLLAQAAHAASPAVEPDIRRDATVMAVEKVLPSVVNIATETIIESHDWYDEVFRQFFGYAQTPPRQQHLFSLGSGVIIDEDGYILTNLHVVRRASRIQIKLWDGREYDAEPCVYSETTDIALLKLKTKPGEKFKAIQLAADDDLLLGETVIALGNPFGLGGSVTRGILSAKNRRRSTGDEPLEMQDWLQTDAAINPGNSGGPLVNLRGELIGLNVAVYREDTGQRGMGVGFSIPVKQVSATLARFFTPEMSCSLWFGAQLKAEAGSLVVSKIQPGSPAARAGLVPGDHLLQIDGQQPRTLVAYNRLVAAARNATINLLVRHGSERRNVSIKLLPLQELLRARMGLALAPLSPQAAQRLGVSGSDALLVESVDKTGPAGEVGLRRGDLLAAIDGHNASKLSTVAEILFDKKKGDSVHLNVIVPRGLGGGFVEVRQGEVDLELR